MEVIEIVPKVEVKTKEALALVYTPHVAKSCLEIKENIDRIFDLTNRSNSIGVISYDYKKSYARSIYLKKTKNIDCYPLEIKKTNKDDINFVIENIMPNFMGVDTVLLGGGEIEADCTIATQSKGCLYEDKIEKLCPIELRELFGGVIETKISENEFQKPVAIVTDGSAVLGLGDIGSCAALPVMEGKAVLFKNFADVNACPICIKSQNADEIIKIVLLLENSFSAINLEDIKAPRCFVVENELIEKAAIPIFHDDQHGTAIVVSSGLLNALFLVHKKLSDVKIVISGAGSAGSAICKLLIKLGAKNIVMTNRKGIVYKNNPENYRELEELAKITNKENLRGDLKLALKNADVFIGVSAPDILKPDMIKEMNADPIIFALANPTPEILPPVALDAGAKIVASGRSDFDNQINNCLAFPGLFAGVIKSGCKKITDEVKIQCVKALTEAVETDELDYDYIIPDALNLNVAKKISSCIIEFVRKNYVEHEQTGSEK